jgi:hypothetical protein
MSLIVGGDLVPLREAMRLHFVLTKGMLAAYHELERSKRMLGYAVNHARRYPSVLAKTCARLVTAWCRKYLLHSRNTVTARVPTHSLWRAGKRRIQRCNTLLLAAFF